MAAFGAYQLLEGGTIFRLYQPQLPVPKPSKAAEKQLSNLSSTLKAKHYHQYVDVLNKGLQFIQEPSKTLYEHGQLVSMLVSSLFPDEPRLRIILYKQ